jgi:hypothetical protein
MLNKSGTLLFTTFGPNNLIELREAWQSIDDDIHIHPAFSAEDLTRLMVDSNFSDVVIDIERLYIEYRSLQQLWLDIKNTASSNCIVGRPKGLTSTKKWDNFTNILTEKGTPIKITIEIIYATGGKLEGKRPSLPKDIIIPVESINTRNM